MGRRRIRLKLKRRPRDLTKKKVGILCDFCGFSTRYGRDHMESELKRLRVLTRRMTGKDLDGLSFTELVFLENHLREFVLPIVKKKKEQLEEDLERLRIQSETVDDGYGGRVKVIPCRVSSSTNSSGEIRVSEAEAMARSQIEFERRKAESMEMEFERLWLLKERLNGRELEGMTYREICILHHQIYQGLRDLRERKFVPTSRAGPEGIFLKHLYGAPTFVGPLFLIFFDFIYKLI